jgi:hypothetical protein
VNRFKDPYAAWMLRKSGWASTPNWYIPILKFLWDDPEVTPRDPALASEVELPRYHLFSGVGDSVMRDGWGPDSTWIEFTSGPYLSKHQHLDQNQFTIFHHGYLAITAPRLHRYRVRFLNYYRRTIAHNTMLTTRGEPSLGGKYLARRQRRWPAHGFVAMLNDSQPRIGIARPGAHGRHGLCSRRVVHERTRPRL